MSDKIKMVKGGEELPVHPGAVENYKRAGWSVFVAENSAEPVVESLPELTEAVSVETAQPQATLKAAGKRKPKDKAVKKP